MKVIKPLEELAESLREHIVKEMQAEIDILKAEVAFLENSLKNAIAALKKANKK
jgi:MoaA/NifB/PqqE/SkfB family radical SAM enzyme